MNERSGRSRKRVQSSAALTRTRSFPCPDDLWAEVERFASENDLGSPAAAARLLLGSGLRVERRAREFDAARAWQIEQAWADVKAIAAGDVQVSDWSEIDKVAEQARRRVRERSARKARTAPKR